MVGTEYLDFFVKYPLMCLSFFIHIKITQDIQAKKNYFFSIFRPLMVDFLMPESDRDKGENPIVDSLAMGADWTVVSKCALHGLIYVWDLKSTVKKIDFDSVTKG